MEVHEDDARASPQRFDFFEDPRERIVQLLHEDAAHDVNHADRAALRGAREIAAIARHAGGEVGWTQEAGFGADVVDGFSLGPDVVAGGHDIHPPVQQLVADLAGDASACGRVFRVGDYQVDRVVL